jgi:hypothetical protein
VNLTATADQPDDCELYKASRKALKRAWRLNLRDWSETVSVNHELGGSILNEFSQRVCVALPARRKGGGRCPILPLDNGLIRIKKAVVEKQHFSSST